MRPISQLRSIIANYPTFIDQVMMQAISHAHTIMNLTERDERTLRLQAKATELLNQPDQFKARLALSVASQLTPQEVQGVMADDLSDSDVDEIIVDIFDALAGVTPPPADPAESAPA